MHLVQCIRWKQGKLRLGVEMVDWIWARGKEKKSCFPMCLFSSSQYLISSRLNLVKFLELRLSCLLLRAGTLALWWQSDKLGLDKVDLEKRSSEGLHSSLPRVTGWWEDEPGSSQVFMVQEYEAIAWVRQGSDWIEKESFFTLKTVCGARYLERFPSSEVFTSTLDKAVGNLVWPHCWPCFDQ